MQYNLVTTSVSDDLQLMRIWLLESSRHLVTSLACMAPRTQAQARN